MIQGLSRQCWPFWQRIDIKFWYPNVQYHVGITSKFYQFISIAIKYLLSCIHSSGVISVIMQKNYFLDNWNLITCHRNHHMTKNSIEQNWTLRCCKKLFEASCFKLKKSLRITKHRSLTPEITPISSKKSPKFF